MSVHGVPILEEVEIAQLARCFADAIPEEEMSVWPHFPAASVSVLTHKFTGCKHTRVFGQESSASSSLRRGGH